MLSGTPMLTPTPRSFIEQPGHALSVGAPQCEQKVSGGAPSLDFSAGERIDSMT